MISAAIERDIQFTIIAFVYGIDVINECFDVDVISSWTVSTLREVVCGCFLNPEILRLLEINIKIT